MKTQKFIAYTALGVASALTVGCNQPGQANLDAVDSLNDQQTAEVITVRDGGDSGDVEGWSAEQELALDTLSAGYFSTKK
ncbi:hypothetical protein VB780_03450 [Leptolyngbya sp. CCNP1308]|uniref:hypothetical protein n=1 Tax=Leptolyngbya sp. CCNP1308 TaxID=3110255 RepID=UPI002B21AA64|nr:hypothetical protein [Leptolyngbya sp. CCNP1308]MEA5447610.1 hypothetical protein [Leptolyngbya sp. CCNP1308]